MKNPVLVLNSNYIPHRIVDWQTAFVLIYSKDNGAYVADFYDKTVHDSKGRPYKLPAVIVLKTYIAVNDKRASFSKRTVHIRDNWVCQYCGGKFSPDKVNLDHVCPRTRPGKLPTGIKMNSFENCVTACIACNSRKADKTLQEAKMRLLKTPVAITRGQKMYYEISRRPHLPQEWLPYIESMSTDDRTQK